MKKLIVIILFLLFPIKISAKSVVLEQDYNNELWYVMKEGNNNYFSRQYVRYNINDNVVFCIQPGVEITTNSYIEDDLTSSLYQSEINKKLELIGYYGYDYPNHQTLEYRMATQALIWETVSGKKIEFWTGPYGTGNYINIDFEKKEILNLINSHNIKPIDNNVINTTVNEEIEIGISLINNYEIIKTEKFSYRIEDNKLYIIPLVVGNIEINFRQKLYDELKTTIYKGENKVSQNVALFRISEPISFNININSYGKIEVNKYGEKQIIKDKELFYEEVPLEDVEFSLYATEDIKNSNGEVIFEKNDLIDSKTTDKNGFLFFDRLELGTYKLVETKTLHNYILDNNEYIVNIENGDTSKIIKIKNELKKTIVEVPSTNRNKSFFMEIILIILGGLFIYAKKVEIK